MPDKSSSFVYEHDGLLKGLNATSYYDYYNRLIDRYQKERSDLIWKEGTFDDNQLAKERYTDPAEFISHTAPLSNFSLLFANRKNGYLAYTKDIPETPLDPIAGLDFLTVSSFFEYLARVKGTAYEGFFYIGNQLSCFAKVTDNVEVITNNGNIPLLFFAESFVFEESTNKSDGIIGKATLTSPYFSDIVVDVYTEDSTNHLEKYYIYAQTSSNDPNPVGKIPGEPIFKTFVINDFDSTIKKIKINGVEIDTTTPATTAIIGSDDRFFKGYIGFLYIGNGMIETAFTFQLQKDPLESADFTISYYIDDKWTDDRTCTVYFTDNAFHSLTTTITIDPQDMYLDVPTIYTLRAETRYFLQNWESRDHTDLYYLDSKLTVPLEYLRKEDSRYVFRTESVIVPSEEGRKPNEYMFTIENTYLGSDFLAVPIWMYGYTTNEINRIPDDFILVTPKVVDKLTYTEYEKREYNFEFTWRGTIELIGVELKRISDSYGYFRAEDFTWEVVGLADGTWKYKLGLDKKIIAEPIAGLTEIPLRILFKYKVQRKDLSQSYWPAETVYQTLTLKYVEDRWEIVDATIDNKLLGDSTIYYKIRDKLLNLYTDKYSDDLRLAPVGTMVFSSNVEKLSENMDWDIRTKTWQSAIKILSYGDITAQFKGVNAESKPVTLKHDLPVHPLKVTPKITDTYVYVMCRITVDLTYNDKITSIYIDGSLVGDRTPFKLDNVKDGYAYLSPIYNATRTEITGIGLDLTPTKQQDIPVTLNFNGVNDYDYSNWPVTSTFTIPVKSQSEKVNFVFILGDDFAFGKNSTGKLKLNDKLLADGKIVATVKNAANGVVVAKPNFNPVGDGDFDTINLYIDEYLSSQKEYYLDFEVFEYVNASKDNSLPYQLYYLARIPFKVP